MDLKYLRTFRTVVTEGSFSKAAERLNYTQSTITFQMNALEEEAGAKLFEKIGRKMTLTKAGEQFLPYVDDVLAAVDRLSQFESDLSACRGELRVGVGETLLCYKLPPIVRTFTAQAPQARLFIRSMNCYEIRDALLDGSLDLGVFYEDIGGLGDQLTIHPMGSYPLALAASPDVAARYPDFITPQQRIPVPFLINEQRCIFRQIFERYLTARGITLDRTIELWSIPTIKNLVMSGMGVTYLPRFAIEEELRSGVLVQLPTALGDAPITAVCAHHKNKWQSPLMELFIRLCTQPQ